jgi:16S rRNA (uracil1498-N3)-methyltransferase
MRRRREARHSGGGACQMRVIRSFVDIPLSPGQQLALPESAAAHLVRVLRLRAGDDCVLFNGDGNDYAARLVAADKRGASVEITGSRQVDNESPLRLVLVQGIARGEKMDLILQKATELGVARVVPVDAERTEVRLQGERLRKRVEHWRGVMVSACEQSGRARLPALAQPVAIGGVGAELEPASLRLTLDPGGTQSVTGLSIRSVRRGSMGCGWARASCAPRPPAWRRWPRCRRSTATCAPDPRPLRRRAPPRWPVRCHPGPARTLARR